MEIEMHRRLHFNKYMPIAVLYFFLNKVFLPFGMLYTTLLTPFFILWLYNTNSFKYIWYFFLLLFPYSIIHFYNGVNTLYYIKSALLLFSVYIFCLSLYQLLKKCNTLRRIYRNIIIINFVLVVIAVIGLMVPALSQILWYNNEITSGFSRIKRLQLLTYEPSYYSTLLAPIALYYYIKVITDKILNPKLIFLLVTIPLTLSLSFGVISALLFSLIIITIPNVRSFFPRISHPLVIIIIFILLCIVLLIIAQVYPENVLFVRLKNVFSGNDSSFRGRTFDSFFLGWEIAGEKSVWFGCGPGQTKLLGLDNFKKFYNYELFTNSDVNIPNSLGDTLATFGITGISIRLLAEIVLFFKTKVYSNYYRLALFLFIFIYQFTGSFISNIAEYAIWILAFYSPLFPEFDRKTTLTDLRFKKLNQSSETSFN